MSQSYRSLDERSLEKAQGEFVFLQLVSVFVGAVRCGVLEVDHAKEPLAHFGRFGATYDAVVRKLIDVLRDEGIYNKVADTVLHVAGSALQTVSGSVLRSMLIERSLSTPSSTVSMRIPIPRRPSLWLRPSLQLLSFTAFTSPSFDKYTQTTCTISTSPRSTTSLERFPHMLSRRKQRKSKTRRRGRCRNASRLSASSGYYFFSSDRLLARMRFGSRAISKTSWVKQEHRLA